MSDGDRPAGDADGGTGVTDGTPSAAEPRLRLYPGGAEPRPARRPALEAVADRLSVLERRVEEALAASTLGGGAAGREIVNAALDETLAVWATVGRWSGHDGRWSGRDPRATVGRGETLVALWLQSLYRYWWRVETVGLERVPAAGRVLLVANRAGALFPYELLMIGVALEHRHHGHRRARPLVDDWLVRLPLVGQVLAATGARRATPSSLRRLLERDEATIVLPEGAAAVAKSFGHRYRLAHFGRGGFARVAIATGTPIVPVAVIGAEEIHPVLARLDGVGRLIGLPTLPITPTFPWLGLAGLVPLPTKWTLHFGEPIDVPGRWAPAASADSRQLSRLTARLRDLTRERLQALVVEGLRRRRSVFAG